MDFAKREQQHSKPQNRRSIDGFLPQNRSLVPVKTDPNPAFKLDSQASYTDGFTPQSSTISNDNVSPPNPLDRSLPLHHESSTGKRKLSFSNFFKYSGIFMSLILVSGMLIGSVIFGKAWLAKNKIFRGGGSSSTLFSTDIKPELLKGEGDGRINVLLVGIGGGDHDGANLTDSIVIASIDPIAKDIAMLSIPRDLYVRVPDYWSMKINAAYSSAYGQALENGTSDDKAREAGFATLENVIEQNIGVHVHYHALVNFVAFQQGVDAVGGVDINVKEDLYDDLLAGDNFNNPWIARKGQTHFDGKVGLLYAQSRHTSSDFARGERQREMLVALKEKIFASGTFSNPSTVSKLIGALGNNVTTNITLPQMLRMYDITKQIPSSSIASIGLTDEPNVLITTGNINDQSIDKPVAGLDNFDDIKAFVRNTLRDPFLKSENATIAILNGTTEDGLANKKATELRSYGYNVTIVDSAPTKEYKQTVIYDKTAVAKKYTRNYLEKRVGTKVSTEPASSNPILVTADFVVILGSNEIPAKNSN